MMHKIATKFFYVLFCLSLMLASIGVQPAYAAAIVVNTNADNLTDDGLCTLREAITTANSDTGINTGDCTTGSGADVITFASDYIITLSFSSGGQLPAITSTVTITGIGQVNTIIQAGASAGSVSYRVLEVSGSGNLTLNNLTVRYGNCISGSCATDASSGGGILNGNILTLSNVLVSLNSAAHGGGVHNKSGATLTATNSTFSSNTVSVFGPEDGAAIMNNGGTVNIISSTISANVSNGGGILSNVTSGTLNITNSTVTGNTFGSGGGHVVSSIGTTLTITNSTIANNTLATGGYVGVYVGVGTLHISNSIVYGHTNGYDCVVGSTLGTNTNNIIGVNGTTAFNTCGVASNSDPLLGTLANNGGPTQTLALLSGSPAINTGDNATCTAAPVNNLDQRGVTRPIGTNCDIGAYEKLVDSGFPTFADVPTNGFAWAQIESINFSGITSGCTTLPKNYCPSGTVTRAQMAVFLMKGIHGSSYTPPAATGTVFNDVALNSFAAAYIEAFADEGITGGCGGGNFCPDGLVTRAQMAVFLLKAKHGSGFSPPTATGTMFTDVATNSFAAAWIEQLATEGITGGCGGGNYCPNNSVTRAQMAVFLQKTFNLALP